jgi:hypothetical protein
MSLILLVRWLVVIEVICLRLAQNTLQQKRDRFATVRLSQIYRKRALILSNLCKQLWAHAAPQAYLMID